MCNFANYKAVEMASLTSDCDMEYQVKGMVGTQVEPLAAEMNDYHDV